MIVPHAGMYIPMSDDDKDREVVIRAKAFGAPWFATLGCSALYCGMLKRIFLHIEKKGGGSAGGGNGDNILFLGSNSPASGQDLEAQRVNKKVTIDHLKQLNRRFSSRKLTERSNNHLDRDLFIRETLGDDAPPKWALLLIGCLLGLAAGICAAAFNRGVHVIHECAVCMCRYSKRGRCMTSFTEINWYLAEDIVGICDRWSCGWNDAWTTSNTSPNKASQCFFTGPEGPSVYIGKTTKKGG